MLEFLAAATMYTDTGLTYCGHHTSSIVGPWVALPEGDDWQCNDLIVAWTVGRDGQERFTFARALDAGPFGNNCVMQPSGLCASILLDVPLAHWQHGEDTSARVVYYQNISVQARAN